MAKRNIGATLSIKDGNFRTGIKNAITQTQNLKTHTTNATGSLKKLGSQGTSVGTSLGSLAKKVTGVVAAYAGFSKIVDFSKECISLCDVQVKVEACLEQLMMNVKGTTLENVDAMKKYAGELQGVTTIGDEATIQGASQLATFQLQSSTIKTLLPSLQDLAVSQYGVSVSGDQMQQMANLMGKVMTEKDNKFTVQKVLRDEDSVSKYGLLQEVIKIDPEKENANTVAIQNLAELNKLKETYSFEIIEDINSYTRAGYVIPVNGYNYVIESSGHSIKKGIHYVKLDLRKVG